MLDLDYDVKQWYARVQGLEFEAERGARCTGWHANTIILHFTPFLSFLFLTYFLSFYLPSVCTVDLPYRIQLVSIHYTMLWRMPWRGTAEMSYCNIVHCSISCKSCFAVICHAKVYYRVPCGTTQCSVLTLYHNKNHHTDAHTQITHTCVHTHIHTRTHLLSLSHAHIPIHTLSHYLRMFRHEDGTYCTVRHWERIQILHYHQCDQSMERRQASQRIRNQRYEIFLDNRDFLIFYLAAFFSKFVWIQVCVILYIW